MPHVSGVQPPAYSMEYINDHYFDAGDEATVQGIEEAIINAMVAAESMATVKPPGYILEAIDHNRLKETMKLYHRLKE